MKEWVENQDTSFISFLDSGSSDYVILSLTTAKRTIFFSKDWKVNLKNVVIAFITF